MVNKRRSKSPASFCARVKQYYIQGFCLFSKRLLYTFFNSALPVEPTSQTDLYNLTRPSCLNRFLKERAPSDTFRSLFCSICYNSRSVWGWPEKARKAVCPKGSEFKQHTLILHFLKGLKSTTREHRFQAPPTTQGSAVMSGLWWWFLLCPGRWAGRWPSIPTVILAEKQCGMWTACDTGTGASSVSESLVMSTWPQSKPRKVSLHLMSSEWKLGHLFLIVVWFVWLVFFACFVFEFCSVLF